MSHPVSAKPAWRTLGFWWPVVFGFVLGFGPPWMVLHIAGALR